MHIPFEDLMPVREALYGPDGLFPEVTRAEVTLKIGPITKRRAWSGASMRTQWVRVEDVAKAKSSLRSGQGNPINPKLCMK